MEFDGVAVLTKEPQSQFFGGKGYKGCVLRVTGRPESITLHVQAEGNGITPIAIYEMQPYEYPNDKLAFELVVPVTWNQRGDIWIPHTRLEEKDFMNVILVDSQLHIVDIQISLLSRKGQFCIVAQQVYAGWMRVVNEEVQFIPSDSVFAYPGMDYRTIWKGRGRVLATMARIVHEVLLRIPHKIEEGGLKEVTAATWDPRKVPVLEGWRVGHVLFYNPIVNYGHLRGGDGTVYFVHGNNLVGVEGPVHMLEPMEPVSFRPGKQEKGRDLIPVQSCKPA